MVGAGKDDALGALLARCLVQVVQTDDVGLQNGRKRPFDRHTAKVDDGVDALEQVQHRRFVAQFSQADFFCRIGGRHVQTIREAQHLAIGLEPGAHGGAEGTGGAGHQ